MAQAIIQLLLVVLALIAPASAHNIVCESAQKPKTTADLFKYVQADPCTLGPNYWCTAPNGLNQCQSAGNVIGVCGYSSGKCPVTTQEEFCSNPSYQPLAFNGGIVGANQGLFGYFAFALYWAPTSCQADSGAGGGFCSDFTISGSHAASNLVLHGLWPDFGSAAYPGAPDFSLCHVNAAPALCPWVNASSPTFSQSDYETCVRAEGIKQCQVPDETVAALGDKFEVYAPGYLAAKGVGSSFLDHEFFKHGSCLGGYLTSNTTAYFETGLGLTKVHTRKGSVGYELVHKNAGGSVPTAKLVAAFKNRAVPRCTRDCKLSEMDNLVSSITDAAVLVTKKHTTKLCERFE
eukprot:jgi/Chlat1/3268/Chrsp22S03440